MASTKSPVPPTRRTTGARRRRRNIADASAGLPLAPELPDRTVRGPLAPGFRVALYLCAADGTALEAQRRACTAHAGARGWTVDAVFEDPDHLRPPEARPVLGEAVGHVAAGRATAVLAFSAPAVSPLPQETDEVARSLRHAGGLLRFAAGGDGPAATVTVNGPRERPAAEREEQHAVSG
jgi:hypothetical protein